MEVSPITEEDLKELEKYNGITQENIKEGYTRISDTYEHMLADVLGYPDPQKTLESIIKYEIPKDAAILDFGCGTGLAGDFLSKAGYTNITGIDVCPDMLAKAEGRGYKELREVFLCKNEFPEDLQGKFDVAISVGLLSHFLSPDVFYEKISCLKPKESEDDKRYIIFTTREESMENFGYNAKLDELEKEGKMTLVERYQLKRYQNLDGQDNVGEMKSLTACCCVYTI